MQTKEPKAGDTWYRCRAVRYASVDEFDRVSVSHPTMSYDTFTVERITPKGVWLDGGLRQPRFVRLSAHKRFAHSTKEEALQAFMARKDAQLRILTNQTRSATEDRRLAEFELNKLQAQSAQARTPVEEAAPLCS